VLTRLRPLVLGLAGVLAPALAAAQVGHPPAGSPYRELARGNSVTFFGGRFEGNGGSLGVGPNTAYTYGARFEFRSANPLSFGAALHRGTFERLIVEPRLPSNAGRVSGPVDQAVTFAEVGLQLNLTGSKTWNHLAPFVGASGGVAFGESTPADTSGYDFGRKFYFAPSAGVRIFFSDRLHLRGEARANFWKLSYPPIFRQQPDPVTPNESEWDLSPWFLVGLGYAL